LNQFNLIITTFEGNSKPAKAVKDNTVLPAAGHDPRLHQKLDTILSELERIWEVLGPLVESVGRITAALDEYAPSTPMDLSREATPDIPQPPAADPTTPLPPPPSKVILIQPTPENTQKHKEPVVQLHPTPRRPDLERPTSPPPIVPNALVPYAASVGDESGSDAASVPEAPTVPEAAPSVQEPAVSIPVAAALSVPSPDIDVVATASVSDPVSVVLEPAASAHVGTAEDLQPPGNGDVEAAATSMDTRDDFTTSPPPAVDSKAADMDPADMDPAARLPSSGLSPIPHSPGPASHIRSRRKTPTPLIPGPAAHTRSRSKTPLPSPLPGTKRKSDSDHEEAEGSKKRRV
jgi:hypothetical protein